MNEFQTIDTVLEYVLQVTTVEDTLEYHAANVHLNIIHKLLFNRRQAE